MDCSDVEIMDRGITIEISTYLCMFKNSCKQNEFDYIVGEMFKVQKIKGEK